MGFANIYHQEAFIGKNRKNNYFEGWYFKLIDRQRDTVLAVIPGVSKNREDAHAFIQVIDAANQRTEYHRFALEEFHADTKRLYIRIGDNEFTDSGVRLDLCGNERIVGSLRFTDIVKYPKTPCSPGIMGPFSFIPWMECYHGIINITHTIHGSLDIGGIRKDFPGGEGYIEKDWGRSFPQKWIWLQANHFEQPACFMFSIARIPWLGRSFTGLIAFLKTGDAFYKFATYDGGKIVSLNLAGNRLEATLQKRGYTLRFRAENAEGGFLKAPKKGLMQRNIEESITAKATVCLQAQNKILFQGSSENTGMEVVDWP